MDAGSGRSPIRIIMMSSSPHSADDPPTPRPNNTACQIMRISRNIKKHKILKT